MADSVWDVMATEYCGYFSKCQFTLMGWLFKIWLFTTEMAQQEQVQKGEQASKL